MSLKNKIHVIWPTEITVNWNNLSMCNPHCHCNIVCTQPNEVRCSKWASELIFGVFILIMYWSLNKLQSQSGQQPYGSCIQETLHSYFIEFIHKHPFQACNTFKKWTVKHLTSHFHHTKCYGISSYLVFQIFVFLFEGSKILILHSWTLHTKSPLFLDLFNDMLCRGEMIINFVFKVVGDTSWS